MHGRFKRAIIIIIDALKYEFIDYNVSLQSMINEKIPPYKNKLTTLNHLRKQKPMHTRQYKFIADPPTTTMQRLKGLTTGSLPTFVDAGANFQSYEIMEDSFIDHLIKQKKKIKFFGDDTWLSLFPKRFYKSFEFPSFNVKDLHSLDNEILKHIYSELQVSDWDVIIAHFIGVDHCGHIYGPNHPAMREKLTQMDSVIRNVTNIMRDDTILFIMGDHGMTKTGDHGGDSADEIEAGLFIYSPAQIASRKQDETEDSIVMQMDFVPTLSLLLGLPIPFSNLGMVIPELFSYCPWWNTASNELRQVYHKIKALRLNAHQINLYLTTYQQIASDLPASKLRTLQQQVTRAESEVQGLITTMISQGPTNDALQKLQSLEKLYKKYIREAREMCENVWAKFDLKMIVAGILTVVLGAVQGLYFLVVWNNDEERLPASAKFLLAGSLLHMLYLVVHISLFSDAVPLMAYTLAVVLMLLNVAVMKDNLIKTGSLAEFVTLENVASTVLLASYCCFYFSNSFIVFENAVSLFLVQTLVCIFSFRIVLKNFSGERKENVKTDFMRYSKKSKSNFELIQVIKHPTTLVLVSTLLCCIVLRITSNFFVCREEQGSCENPFLTFPLASMEGASKNQRYILSVFSLASLVYAFRHWLKYFGNLNGTSPAVVCLSFAPPVAGMFICFHWALQGLPEFASESFSAWQLALMAQAVYIILIASMLTLMLFPLLVYMLPAKLGSTLRLPNQADFQQIIPTLYNQLKVRLTESQGGDEEKPPVVYGLGSAYSASVVAMLSIVSLLLALLLNDGIAPSLLLASIALYLCLELYSSATASEELRKGAHIASPCWAGMILLSLLSTLFFYGTGHQATIPSIRFEAAYTGFYGDFNNFILPGFLIWLNTFAGPIFFNLASPLLVFWPLLSSALVGMMVRKTPEQAQRKATWQGDFKLFNNGIHLRKSMFKLCCGIIVIASLKFLSAATAAALHRRHLMVWKIFAPRMVYEGAMFLTVSVCAFMAFLFVLRVDNVLSKFVKNIATKKGN
ncbi:unnamed protein product [Lymnaea stagnalis]|uniref:GPI ethanolamine phosphate transferase 3 n=1 Tax=Lymnaea stagnalis TaxID=6523 RepID=A0AAV2HRE3_LYMST